ncbi:MAG: GspE/PulE family protein [bacterium]
MFSNAQLKSILKLAGLILDDKKWEEEIKESEAKKVSLADHLADKKIISNDSLYKTAATYFKIPFISLRDTVIRKDILTLVPELIAQNHKIVAFDIDTENNVLKLATTNPPDVEIIDSIQKKYKAKIDLRLTTPEDLNEILKQYHKSLEAEFEAITTSESQMPEGEDALKKLAKDLPVIKIVDTLLEYAVFEGASDIHIEPGEKDVFVRYRVDGILRNVMTLPKTVQAGIIARIKVLSKLKLDEHRLPQDGRFTIKNAEYKVSLRVSILPVYDGEKIVMRLLNESAQVLTLETLGFQKNPLEIIKNNINKPHGMILVTGPTGSGKSTTLYTILNILNKPEVNISTIEDPIEYHLAHINQSQVAPKIGFTFASGLRTLLRQDPNVIMVGEIRDGETAEIAIHAAMTGHLVLSTLHTNDAATTIPRFTEMDIPTFLISTTINVIIAQRLVRKICQNCIKSYQLSHENIEEIERIFNVPKLLETLVEVGAITKSEILKDMLFYRGKGCKKCANSGYKGRIGIYEILEITNEIKELINSKATAKDINKLAVDKGMIKMFEDGVIKAKGGITSLEEVLRVAKE